MKDYSPKQDLKRINLFYLKYPGRLKKITMRKLSFCHPSKKAGKQAKRPNNLPEKGDRLLLAEAIDLNNNYLVEETICLLTNDSDFTKFKKEIKEEYNLRIIEVPKSPS